MNKRRRRGLTLIELLVVMTMMGILLALLLPAVQKVRQASKREACAEKLMQIGLALYSYHDANGSLPAGLDSSPPPPQGDNVYWYWSWMARLLPYIGQEDLWQQADDYARTVSYDPWSGMLPGEPIGNPALRTPLDAWQCPADPRQLVITDVIPGGDFTVAFGDYLGVSGRHVHFDLSQYEGLFFPESQVRFADITNGLSNVLAVGERPPSADLLFGWWFAGFGLTTDPHGNGAGDADVVLGISELIQNASVFPYKDPQGSPCSRGSNDLNNPAAYRFSPGNIANECDNFHYWSLHHHGANFLLADGSVHFFKYTVDPAVIVAMAYRSGGPP